jgi:hypothetical protein
VELGLLAREFLASYPSAENAILFDQARFESKFGPIKGDYNVTVELLVRTNTNALYFPVSNILTAYRKLLVNLWRSL